MLAQHDIAEVVAQTGVGDRENVDTDEEDEAYEAEKVQAAGFLTSTEKTGIPRELRVDGWRLGGRRKNEEWCEQKDDREIAQLVNRQS
ncbi:MAG: hypothetical protein R3B97_11100 [Dehalococcoidia bacterium]